MYLGRYLGLLAPPSRRGDLSAVLPLNMQQAHLSLLHISQGYSYSSHHGSGVLCGMTDITEFQQEGTITGWVNPPSAPNWATDSHGYTFPTITLNSVTASATKYPDRTVEVTVDGPFGRQFSI